MNTTNKYTDALKKYPFALSADQITESINKIIADGYKAIEEERWSDALKRFKSIL